MALFLGYDPGGFSGVGKNGVVAVEIRKDGTFVSEPETKTFRYASEVRDWLSSHPSAKALGVDTLLAWSLKGRRNCDVALREQYKQHEKTVIHQNSLGSSMTINGILVAQFASKIGLPLVESHPKLLRKANLLRSDSESVDIVAHDCALLKAPTDDEADALIAAWCASRWYFKRWKTDLYKTFSRDLRFPAGKAKTFYPWPESVPDP